MIHSKVCLKVQDLIKNRKGGEYVPPYNQVDIIYEQAEKLEILDRILVLKGLFADSINILNKEKKYLFLSY